MASDIITDATDWIDENFRDNGYENVDITNPELSKAHVWYQKLKSIKNRVPNNRDDMGEYDTLIRDYELLIEKLQGRRAQGTRRKGTRRKGTRRKGTRRKGKGRKGTRRKGKGRKGKGKRRK